jgi:maltose O-acetyltransferase
LYYGNGLFSIERYNKWLYYGLEYLLKGKSMANISSPNKGSLIVEQIPNTVKYRLAKKLPKPIKEALLKLYWPMKAFAEDFQDYSSELVGLIPSHAFRLWWYRSICKMQIGKYSSIHRHTRMYQPYKIIIGNYSNINYGVLLDGRRGLVIGNNVNISEGTVILTLGHDIDDPGFTLKGGQVTIEDYVFIGSYARILPALKIGEGAVVAAAAVVTRDVEPYMVVGGIPARFIRNRNRNLTYQDQYRKRFG